MKKLVVIGSGWLGQQLFNHFEQLQLLTDWQWFATRRSLSSWHGMAAKVKPLAFLGEQDSPDLQACLQDAVWLVAMSPGRDRAAYLASLQQIVERAHRWSCQHLLLCSSTGVYSQLAGDVDESSPLVVGNDRVDGLLAAERLALSFPRTTVLRLAGLFGEGRHPGRFCKAGWMAGADLPVNLVHSEQIAQSLAQWLVQQDVPTLLNLVHPEHPTKEEFYTAAARSYGVEPPSFVPADEPARSVHSVHCKATDWLTLWQYLQNIKNL